MDKKRLLMCLRWTWMGALFLALCSCGGGGGGGQTCVDGAAVRTKGCDEFTRISNTVTQSRSGSIHNCAGPWCQLNDKDELAVNSTGQAELHFTACGEGRLFLFQSTSSVVQVSSCTKADFGTPAVVCVKNGALYADQCASEFDPVSGSAKIKKTGSSYLVTYQPEQGDVTVVIVAEGSVQLVPVLSYDPTQLGEPIEVVGGEFVFTMPDDLLREIGGLRPRDKYPVEMLPPLAFELGLQDWVFGAARIAREKQYLPPNWPQDLGGDFITGEPPLQPPAEPPKQPPGEPPAEQPGVMVLTADGGELANPELQLAVYQAIDWMALSGSDLPARVSLSGEIVDPIERAPFDPEKSAEVIRSRFPNGLALLLSFPVEDTQLEGAARVIADYLAKVGVKVDVSPTPGSELMPRIQTMLAAGESLLYLSR
jgi:hypothetical protein